MAASTVSRLPSVWKDGRFRGIVAAWLFVIGDKVISGEWENVGWGLLVLIAGLLVVPYIWGTGGYERKRRWALLLFAVVTAVVIGILGLVSVLLGALGLVLVFVAFSAGWLTNAVEADPIEEKEAEEKQTSRGNEPERPVF